MARVARRALRALITTAETRPEYAKARLLMALDHALRLGVISHYELTNHTRAAYGRCRIVFATGLVVSWLPTEASAWAVGFASGIEAAERNQPRSEARSRARKSKDSA